MVGEWIPPLLPPFPQLLPQHLGINRGRLTILWTRSLLAKKHKNSYISAWYLLA
jgi:hypothetical protein